MGSTVGATERKRSPPSQAFDLGLRVRPEHQPGTLDMLASTSNVAARLRSGAGRRRAPPRPGLHGRSEASSGVTLQKRPFLHSESGGAYRPGFLAQSGRDHWHVPKGLQGIAPDDRPESLRHEVAG